MIVGHKTCPQGESELDYRAAYEHACAESKKLEEANEKLHALLRESEREKDRMSAQLDMVHLIFGGYNR